MKIDKEFFRQIFARDEKRWSAIFLTVFLFLTVWNFIFLNSDAFVKWISAAFNTYLIGVFATLFSFLLAKIFINNYLKILVSESKFNPILFRLSLDILRSIPQVLVILTGYAILIFYLEEIAFLKFIWLSFVLSLVFLNDAYDEMLGRIEFFRKTEFFNASLVAGISIKTIVNKDILLRNSIPFLVNRSVNIFTASVFLLCSADFIISVGLTSSLNLAALPTTLGNVLANISAKEDILAVRELFVNPLYITELFTKHLEGVSAALLLIVTLISGYKISNGIVKSKKLLK